MRETCRCFLLSFVFQSSIMFFNKLIEEGTMRRHLVFSLAAFIFFCGFQGRAEKSVPEHSQEGNRTYEEHQQKQTEVIERLRRANEAYRKGEVVQKQKKEGRWEKQTKAQNPYAMVLTCADSRVPPELLFQAEPGDLYVNRVAGNVVDPVILGSLEYGAEHLHVPVLVVLGHESCGAVQAALAVQTGKAEPDSFNISELLKILLRPAALAVKTGLSGEKLVHRAVVENVKNTMRDIRTLSPVLWNLSRGGELRIVGAVYSLETGAVEWIEP